MGDMFLPDRATMDTDTPLPMDMSLFVRATMDMDMFLPDRATMDTDTPLPMDMSLFVRVTMDEPVRSSYNGYGYSPSYGYEPVRLSYNGYGYRPSFGYGSLARNAYN